MISIKFAILILTAWAALINNSIGKHNNAINEERKEINRIILFLKKKYGNEIDVEIDDDKK